MKVAIKMCLLVLTSLYIQGQCLALEKETHKALQAQVARDPMVGGGLLNKYLTENLGFTSGVEDILTGAGGKAIWKLIQDGGQHEDEPIYTRSLNHFHDPLKPWGSAGLKGMSKSALLWAQEQGDFGSSFGGYFSWKAVREYLYIALTGRTFAGELVAYTQSQKERYFGYAFRGLGQLMHLVQDMSVPSHTRNDSHISGRHYETVVDEIRLSRDMNVRAIFMNALAHPITFDPSILSLPPDPLAPVPIAKIFDTDQYTATNPDPGVTAGATIGLSEYTNANFVSEGLASANFQDYPNPRIADTTMVVRPYAGPSGTHPRKYYAKNCCGESNSGKGYLLAAVDYLDHWRQKHPLLSVGLSKIPGLDDNVYRD